MSNDETDRGERVRTERHVPKYPRSHAARRRMWARIVANHRPQWRKDLERWYLKLPGYQQARDIALATRRR